MSESIASEMIRREATATINANATTDRDKLLAEYGAPVLDTSELQAAYSVKGFAAPCVIVERKADGKRGTLMFQHSPRLYFGWRDA